MKPPQVSLAKLKILERLAGPSSKFQFVSLRIQDYAGTWGIDFEDIKAAILVLHKSGHVLLRKLHDKRNGYVDFSPGIEAERHFFYCSDFQMRITAEGLAYFEMMLAAKTESENAAPIVDETFGFANAERAAEALITASGLWSLSALQALYPDDTTKPGPKRLQEFFSNELERALEDAKKDDLLKKYREAKSSPTTSDQFLASVLSVMLIAITAIKKHLGCSDDEVGEAALARCPRRVQEAVNALQEISLFDCQIPRPDGIPEYTSKERFFFLVQKYWEVYRAYLMHYISAEMALNPDPLMRLVTNIRARIGACLIKLQMGELSQRMQVLLDLDLSADPSLYDDWTKERISEIDIEIEQVRLKMGTLHFDLTPQEDRFIKIALLTLDDVGKKLRSSFAELLRKVERDSIRNTAAEHPGAPHDEVGKVEIALRRIVSHETRIRFKEGWLAFIRKAVGDVPYEDARRRMADRGISDEDEVLHFLFLKDIRDLISSEWSLFQSHFSLPKKKWNELMDVVVKGRTDSAHFRPPHLWPPTEQLRLRLACHDLISGIRTTSND